MSGEIKYVEIDGLKVHKGDHKPISWASKHYLTIYYDCTNVFIDCVCKFVIKVDGTPVSTLTDIKVPEKFIGGQDEVPIQTVIGEIPPGDHFITIEAYEGAPEYNDYQDSFSFYVSVIPKENQTTPYTYPEVYSEEESPLKKYWWAFALAGAIVLGAALLKPKKSELSEMKELVKLKMMEELAEQK